MARLACLGSCRPWTEGRGEKIKEQFRGPGFPTGAQRKTAPARRFKPAGLLTPPLLMDQRRVPGTSR
jgi:hypothetical protein